MAWKNSKDGTPGQRLHPRTRDWSPFHVTLSERVPPSESKGPQIERGRSLRERASCLEETLRLRDLGGRFAQGDMWTCGVRES